MKKSVFALLFVLVAGNICGQTIFVSQPSASRILKINAATGGAEVFYNWGSSPPASGLAMGPDGRLYFNLEYTVSGQVTISRMKQDGSQLENIFATSSLTLINTLFFTGPDLYFVALTVVTENNWHWDIWKIKDLGSIAYGQKFPEPVVFFTGYYCPPFNHGLTLTPSGVPTTRPAHKTVVATRVLTAITCASCLSCTPSRRPRDAGTHYRARAVCRHGRRA